MTARRAAAVLLVGALAGCAGGTAGVPLRTEPSGTVSPSTMTSTVTTVDDACPEQEAEHVPPALEVTDAYLCGTDVRAVPGDGQWQFRTVRRVTGDLSALIKAYEVADAGVTNGACTSDLPSPRVVWLHTRSATVAARAPRDRCGKPTREARQAYDALPTQEVRSVEERQVASQLSVDSRCSDAYKDMIAIEDEDGAPKQTQALPTPIGVGARLCSYEVRPDESGMRVGHLRAARVLSREQLDAFNAELRRAELDPTCSRQRHQHFALVVREASGLSTLVATDGCAVQQDGGWWRATPQLRALVHAR